ncbi:MAG TPA: hypothetical protein PKW95_20655 [bacterium]|nr:hypothetical protein [bacterium]
MATEGKPRKKIGQGTWFFRRRKIPIFFMQIGLMRILFFSLCLGAAELVVVYLAASEWLVETEHWLLVLLAFCLNVPLTASLMLSFGRWWKEQDTTWLWLKLFGERKLNRLDLLLAVMLVAFFAGQLVYYYSTVHWYHYLFFGHILGAFVVNLFSRKDLSALDPEGLPWPDPAPDPPMPQPTEDGAAPVDLLFCNYLWSSLAGSNLRLAKFPVPTAEYTEMVNINQELLEDGCHPMSQYEDKILKGLSPSVERLVSAIAETHFTGRNLVRLDNLLQFVHQFPYVTDQESKGFEDYARFPIETMVEKKGDCECLSILLAALFKLHNYNTALLLTKDHCMVGVEVLEEKLPGDYHTYQDIKYYVCEATGEGWQVGQKPEEGTIVNTIPL